MRKIILPIIVLMLANIGFATTSKDPVLTQCAVKNGDDKKDLDECKTRVSIEIDKFKFDSGYKAKLTEDVKKANTIEDINKIYKQAEELNNEVVRIRKKIEDVIDYLDDVYPENENANEKLYQKELGILNQAHTSTEAKEKEKQIFNDPEIKKYENESMLYKNNGTVSKEYLKGYIKPFYYKNNNIFDNYNNDDIFFDLKLGGDVSSSNFLSSLTLGGAYKLKKTNVKLGGFVQYDYEISHNISLGTSVVYDNFLGFVRYRLATYKGKINHNVDAFGKYYYEFRFDKLKVIPTVSLYTTVSSKLGLIKKKDDDMKKVDVDSDDDEENTTIEYSSYLLPRIGFDLNLGTKISYQVLKNLSIFTEPTITVSYNDQRVIKEKNMMENKMINNEKEIITINRSYFGYDINFGVEYKKKGISVKPILRLTGDMLGNVSLNTNLGIGYKF